MPRFRNNSAISSKRAARKPNRYVTIIATIFQNHYHKGILEFDFSRDEFTRIARDLHVDPPKNLGDVLYSFRFRTALPEGIVSTAPKGMEWIIELAGRGQYRFRLVPINRILPREDLLAIKIPDATPEIISTYALNDEQALLARVRYNRLIDIFLGIAAYSLQNHLRTTVRGIGQIEIDEIYVGVNRNGQQFVIPVQAKGGSDRLGTTQAKQDMECCREKFPQLTCRSIAAQFMPDNVIALFELTLAGDDVMVVDEKHYCLVPADQIGVSDLTFYAQR